MTNNVYNITSNIALPQLGDNLEELILNFKQNLLDKHKKNINQCLKILIKNNLLPKQFTEILNILKF